MQSVKIGSDFYSIVLPSSELIKLLNTFIIFIGISEKEWNTNFFVFKLWSKCVTCGHEVLGIILLQMYLFAYGLLRGVTFEAAMYIAQQCCHCW
jgi:hypothetical protein